MFDFLTHHEFWIYTAIGFAAQLVDGALGMAYGTLSTSILLASGVPPLTVSASVHTAQFFTSGISAFSHAMFKNINKRLFLSLAIAGSVGGVLGALVLTHMDDKFIKPWVASYLMVLGGYILWKRFGKRLTFKKAEVGKGPFGSILGFVGGFLDALGGGWGPMVTSSLIARNTDPRYAIGSVNSAEFFVKTTIALTFITTLGFTFHETVLGLLLGGVIAAPLGAFVLRIIKPDYLITLVGILIMFLSAITLYNALHI